MISTPEHRTPLYQGLGGFASLCCARLAGNSLLPTFLLSQPQKPGQADLDLLPPICLDNVKRTQRAIRTLGSRI
jgi:hypothetical protein